MSEYMHKELAEGRWENMSICEQMANIGSEVNRAIAWKNKHNKERTELAAERAIELIDLSVDGALKKGNSTALKEFCRLREVVADCLYDCGIYDISDQEVKNIFFPYAVKWRMNS